MTALAFGIYIAVHALLLVYLFLLLIRLLPLVVFARQPLPFIPVNRRVARMIAQLPELAAAQTIIDLGCGTGSLLATITPAHPTATTIGIEYNQLILRFAQWRSRWWRKQPRLILGDMFTYPLHQVDAIVGWWVPDFARRLLPKFLAECQSGCVIVSYMFPLPDHPELKKAMRRCGRDTIYIYCRR